MKKHTLRNIILILMCTVMTSIGQVFFKYSTKHLESFYAIITNMPLIAGIIFYAIGAILLITALKDGELSVLYPFISLSFIWVALLSIWLFGDKITIVNWLGILSIIIGISLIGYGSQK